MSDTAFIDDISSRRTQARKHIMNGAVTEGFTQKRETIIKLLNEALATELICVLRYKAHYFNANGAGSTMAKEEFLEHADEEQAHADRLAERISQLGGQPDFNPETLMKRSHSEYHNKGTTMDMLKEDLIAERIAIDSYREMIRFAGEKDPTTRRILEDILAQEEEHADDLVDLIEQINDR